MLLGDAAQRLVVLGEQRSQAVAELGIGAGRDAQLQPHRRVGGVDDVTHAGDGGVRIGFGGDLAHRRDLAVVELGQGGDEEVLARREVTEQAALGDAGTSRRSRGRWRGCSRSRRSRRSSRRAIGQIVAAVRSSCERRCGSPSGIELSGSRRGRRGRRQPDRTDRAPLPGRPRWSRRRDHRGLPPRPDDPAAEHRRERVVPAGSLHSAEESEQAHCKWTRRRKASPCSRTFSGVERPFGGAVGRFAGKRAPRCSASASSARLRRSSRSRPVAAGQQRLDDRRQFDRAAQQLQPHLTRPGSITARPGKAVAAARISAQRASMAGLTRSRRSGSVRAATVISAHTMATSSRASLPTMRNRSSGSPRLGRTSSANST